MKALNKDLPAMLTRNRASEETGLSLRSIDLLCTRELVESRLITINPSDKPGRSKGKRLINTQSLLEYIDGSPKSA